MSSNHLPIEQRLQIGKISEQIILDEINSVCPIEIEGLVLTAFTPSTHEEDMHGKIDAWAHQYNGTKHSVQIKNRESGSDLGIAVMMPYESDRWFCSNFKGFKINLDRDMQNVPDYYLVANEGQICVVPGATVKAGVMAILSSLFNNGGFKNNRAYSYPALDGLELRLVKDKGAGYSAGKRKVICYISLTSLEKRGAFLENR